MDKVDYGKKPMQMEDYGMDRRHYHVDACDEDTHHCGEDINDEEITSM